MRYDHPWLSPWAHPRALLLWWGWIAGSAFILGAPLASFAAKSFMHEPAGDAVAFQPGAWQLLEFLQRTGDGLRALSQGTSIGLLALLVASEVPIATFVVQRTRDGSLLSAWGAACAKLPWLALGAVVTRLLQALLILMGWVTGSLLVKALTGSVNEPVQTLCAMLWSLPPLASIAAAGVLRDVWRAQLFRPGAEPLSALRVAFEVCRARSLELGLWWAAPTMAGWLTVMATGYLVTQLRVESPESWRWGSVLLLHQLVAATLVYTRAVWFCAAIRAVEDA